MREDAMDINPTCGAEGNYLASEMQLKTLYFLQEVEKVVSPTAGLSINPDASTRRKFKMDIGEECIHEEAKRMVDPVMDDNDYKKNPVK